MNTTQLFTLFATGFIFTLSTPCYAGHFAEKHPRRAQVLERNGRTNSRLNADEGSLHGNYKELKSENKSIHSQEKSDAQANGGHITKAEQGQLNQEHNQLNRQIRQDRR